MSEEIYFQWQNPHLSRTIYPLREMKLRDFLLHYFEIDTWAAYREKTLQDIETDIEAFRASQTALVTSLQAAYDHWVTYFQGKRIDIPFSAAPEELDQSIIDQLVLEHKSFDQYFLNYDTSRRQRIYLDRYINRTEKKRKSIQSEIARNQRNIINVPTSWKVEIWQQRADILSNMLPIVDLELSRLYEFLSVFITVQKQRAELDQLLAQKKKEKTRIETDLRWKRNFVRQHPDGSRTPEFEAEIKLLEQSLERIDQEIRRGLTASIEDRLKAQIEKRDVSVNDIVRWKAEQYQEELEAKDHAQLLEDIVSRFLAEPKRYPLWLQYMVVHFSGMRYRSAHGSWGDPKDLLLSLRIKDIEKDLKSLDNAAILNACIQEAAKLRRLLDTGQIEDEFEYHLGRLESENPYRRRRALFDYRIDQEKKSIETSTEAQTLDALIALEDQLPGWMWKEVVARTQLRLRVIDDNWEKLTPEERSERLERDSGVYRELMADWKRKHLTGWRAEHDRAIQLIVTRAVCNEVAEHIQHLRAHSPPGGLTAKPPWYLGRERSAGQDGAFFRKPRVAEDFEVGASILWLRWVKDKPNPWRITHPLQLENGEGLLPSELIKPLSAKIRRQLAKRLKKEKGNTSHWIYENTGDAFRRTRARVVETEVLRNKRKKTILARVFQEQWLRWMHEATVAEVAETADGPVILTFETALPYDDPRRSTIGIYKRSVRHLRYFVTGRSFNGTFVGYMPEGQLPIADLKEMLDWNKILLREALTEAETETFWRQVTEA
jgi:hypothetical protein